MPKPIVFGEISGYSEGHHFSGRREMMINSFHRSWGRGIDGNAKEGTSAIVLSGGYEDDLDNGEEIIYTGAGGNDPNTGKQIKNQSWNENGNAGLVKSMNEGLPVRVIRGYQHKSKFSPKNGYKYAGLYSVVDSWEEVGKSKFKICRFRLVYSGNNTSKKTAEEIELNVNSNQTKRKEGTILRIIRDSKIATSVKELYGFECQVCGLVIKTLNGEYAEGAHIRPLGKPHNGHDSTDNILCLCPNHHVMFDKGVFSLTDSLEVIGQISGDLKVNINHNINIENIKYHRISHGY